MEYGWGRINITIESIRLIDKLKVEKYLEYNKQIFEHCKNISRGERDGIRGHGKFIARETGYHADIHECSFAII